MKYADRLTISRMLEQGEIREALLKCLYFSGGEIFQNLTAEEIVETLDFVFLGKRLPRKTFHFIWKELRYFIFGSISEMK